MFKVLFYFIFFTHLLVICAAISRKLRAVNKPTSKSIITIVRPCSGVDPYFNECIERGFLTGDWDCKFIFCVASKDDLAYPALVEIKKKHPSLRMEILSEEKKMSFNPKLNNIAQTWPHIEGDFVLIVDSNVRFENDYLEAMMGLWSDDIGLLSSPPKGADPKNFAANLEAAFLNTYQNLWQLAGDAFGNSFAQGKVLFWRKSVLESGGGFEALGHELAEDVASTKLTRRMGYKVKLLMNPVDQPLGLRDFSTIWKRQLRWAKTRRFGFPLIYASEVLSFASTWWWVGIVALMTNSLSLTMFFICLSVRYLGEYVLAMVYNWPRHIKDITAWIVRDFLLFPAWILGYWGRTIEWQGHAMSANDPQKPKDNHVQ